MPICLSAGRPWPLITMQTAYPGVEPSSPQPSRNRFGKRFSEKVQCRLRGGQADAQAVSAAVSDTNDAGSVGAGNTQVHCSDGIKVGPAGRTCITGCREGKRGACFVSGSFCHGFRCFLTDRAMLTDQLPRDTECLDLLGVAVGNVPA